MDIGFNFLGLLDTTTLLSFCGVNSGFVTTLYDATGNSRHAIQTTTGAQPRIVNAGVLETENGQPTIRFLGLQRLVTSLALPSNVSQFTGNVVSRITGGDYGRIIALAPAGTADFSNTQSCVLLYKNAPTTNSLASYRGVAMSVSGVVNNLFVGSSIYGASNNIVYRDGVAGNTVTTSFPLGAVYIGIGGAPQVTTNVEYLVGSISEVTYFDSALSTTDRQTLERNQGAYYGISVA